MRSVEEAGSRGAPCDRGRHPRPNCPAESRSRSTVCASRSRRSIRAGFTADVMLETLRRSDARRIARRRPGQPRACGDTDDLAGRPHRAGPRRRRRDRRGRSSRQSTGARSHLELPVDLMRVRRREGLDRPRRGQPDRRVAVRRRRSDVSLIPETLARTTLGTRAVGDQVNIEVDVLAKYVERLLAAKESS